MEINVRLFELEQLEKDYVPFLTNGFNAKHIFVMCTNRDNFRKFINDHIEMIYYEDSGHGSDIEYERYEAVLPLTSYMDNLVNSDPKISKYITLTSNLEWEETTKEILIKKFNL